MGPPSPPPKKGGELFNDPSLSPKDNPRANDHLFPRGLQGLGLPLRTHMGQKPLPPTCSFIDALGYIHRVEADGRHGNKRFERNLMLFKGPHKVFGGFHPLSLKFFFFALNSTSWRPDFPREDSPRPLLPPRPPGRGTLR